MLIPTFNICFRLNNIHLDLSTCPHKFKWLLCTEILVLNEGLKDFWHTNKHHICFEDQNTHLKVQIPATQYEFIALDRPYCLF